MTAATAAQVAMSKRLVHELRARLIPVVIQWVEDCVQKGIDDTTIRLALSAEALVLSRTTHIGSETMFNRMVESVMDRKH